MDWISAAISLIRWLVAEIKRNRLKFRLLSRPIDHFPPLYVDIRICLSTRIKQTESTRAATTTSNTVLTVSPASRPSGLLPCHYFCWFGGRACVFGVRLQASSGSVLSKHFHSSHLKERSTMKLTRIQVEENLKIIWIMIKKTTCISLTSLLFLYFRVKWRWPIMSTGGVYNGPFGLGRFYCCVSDTWHTLPQEAWRGPPGVFFEPEFRQCKHNEHKAFCGTS